MSTVWSRTFCRGVWWFTLLMLFAELGTCGGGWAQEVKSGPAPSSPAADLERSKAVLQTVYEQQQQFARRTGRWAADWQELGWQPEPAEYRERIWFWIAPGESSITLEAPRGELGANRWRISAEGMISELSIGTGLEAALVRAGEQRSKWEAALRQVAPAERESLEFLITHMPDRDLEKLTAEYLLENIRLSELARIRSPWRLQVPREIYLNYVLP
ncbi:MAG: hypothetical protein ACK54I_00005, partial [Planctomycetota bacterium]